MLERFTDIAKVRAAATKALSAWTTQAAALESASATPNGKAIADIVATLTSGQINAVSYLVHAIFHAAAKGVDRRHLLRPIQTVTFELSRLAQGDIQPTLYLYRTIREIASEAGLQAPQKGCLFLPVMPILPGAGEGGERFVDGIRHYRTQYHAAVARLLKGDDSVLGALRLCVVSIENRQPGPDHYTTIALASAFACAITDQSLVLDDASKQLFSRIDLIFRHALERKPLPDHSVASRLAFALAGADTTHHKRLDVLASRLELHRLNTEAIPSITSFPPMDLYDSAAGSLASAWQVAVTSKTPDWRAVSEALTRFDAVSRAHSGLTEFSAALIAFARGVSSGAVKVTPMVADVFTQALARVLDAAGSRNDPLVTKVIHEECNVLTSITQNGMSFIIRDVNLEAAADVARETSRDIDAAILALREGRMLDAVSSLETVEMVLPVAQLGEAADTVSMILAALRERHDAADVSHVVGALSAMTRYLALVTTKPDEAARLLAEITPDSLRDVAGDATTETPPDMDVFAIFNEEAVEVVGVIMGIVGEGNDEITDAEAFATVRRGFHTLKGSARMAGMPRLGDVMFGVEDAFNAWAPIKPPSLRLSVLAVNAARFVLQACMDITNRGKATISVPEITGVAAELVEEAALLSERAGDLLALGETQAFLSMPEPSPEMVVPVLHTPLPALEGSPAPAAIVPADSTPGTPLTPAEALAADAATIGAVAASINDVVAALIGSTEPALLGADAKASMDYLVSVARDSAQQLIDAGRDLEALKARLMAAAEVVAA